MGYEFITYELDERVALITINRPERLNALNVPTCDELRTAVHAADRDPDVRVLIVTGAGGKAFSAGYDIKDEDDSMKEGVAKWSERLRQDVAFTTSVWRCSKPVIAMIDGYCLAGALEFAQMCDIRYCSDKSKFGVIETRFSAGISTMIMPWVLGQRCRELIYTGDVVDAEEAFRLGLVNRVFPQKSLRDETIKVAKRISQVALACLQWDKRAINHSFEAMGFHSALEYGVEACTLLDSTATPEFQEFDDIRRREGLSKALEWRDKQFAKYE